MDGSIQQYGFAGAGPIEVPRDKSYFSIDLGITFAAWDNPKEFICKAIFASIPHISAALRQSAHGEYNETELTKALNILCEAYRMDAL